MAMVDLKVEQGFPITVRQAILNCWKAGRSHRRRLSRRLGINWLVYLALESKVLKHNGSLPNHR